MTSWTDKTGRRLTVLRRDALNPARVVVTGLPREDGHPDTVAFHLDGEADLAEVAVAMFTADGQPAPVITPRPEVTTRRHQFGPYLSLSVEPSRRVRVAMTGGGFEELEPSSARRLAGLLVAYADAAEQEPDPAEVDALAMVLMEGTGGMGLDGARPLARRILAAGWKREARNDA